MYILFFDVVCYFFFLDFSPARLGNVVVGIANHQGGQSVYRLMAIYLHWILKAVMESNRCKSLSVLILLTCMSVRELYQSGQIKYYYYYYYPEVSEMYKILTTDDNVINKKCSKNSL